jgi:hypothetical protein
MPAYSYIKLAAEKILMSHVRVTLDWGLDWILDLLAKSFPARNVFTSISLVTTSNNGYSSASGLKSSLNGGSLTTGSVTTE